MENKELIQIYQDALKKLNVISKDLVNDQGEITVDIMGVPVRFTLLPSNFIFGLIKTFEEFIGRKMAESFLYRVGYEYGAKITQKHFQAGISKKRFLTNSKYLLYHDIRMGNF